MFSKTPQVPRDEAVLGKFRIREQTRIKPEARGFFGTFQTLPSASRSGKTPGRLLGLAFGGRQARDVDVLVDADQVVGVCPVPSVLGIGRRYVVPPAQHDGFNSRPVASNFRRVG